MTNKTFKEYLLLKNLEVGESTIFNKDQEIERGKTSELSPNYSKKGKWSFEPQVHAPSQATQYRPEFKSSDWHELHDKVHAVLDDKTKQVTDNKMIPSIKDGTVVFYSRKQQQGYVTNVHRPSCQVRLVTVLPKGKSRSVDPQDQRIILDSVKSPIDEIYQFILLD